MTRKAKAETKARRPTPADFPKVFELIADKAISLRAACVELKLHAPSTSTAIQADPLLQGAYDAARTMRGDHFGEKVSDIADGVLAGTYDHQQARVAMDGYKWTAARMAPKAWGDKLDVTANVPGGINVVIQRFTPKPDET